MEESIEYKDENLANEFIEYYQSTKIDILPKLIEIMLEEMFVRRPAIITKERDLRKDGSSNFFEGQKFDAFFWKFPEVGERFHFLEKGRANIQTSEVVEIIDYKTFRTENSIYTIYTLEDQREDKIIEILN
jgi:hypothetical protein